MTIRSICALAAVAANLMIGEAIGDDIPGSFGVDDKNLLVMNVEANGKIYKQPIVGYNISDKNGNIQEFASSFKYIVRINDENGKLVFGVNLNKRTIEVGDDVDVNKAAKMVFDILVKQYLPQCNSDATEYDPGILPLLPAQSDK